MRKTTWLKIINPLMLLLLLSQGATGNFGREMGLGPEAFEKAHGMAGLALVLLALVHLVLNWSWVRAHFSFRRAIAPGKPSA